MQSASGTHTLALFAAILASGLAGRLSGAERTAERPWNFVLLLADDLGWSDLACYGADLHQTPNLDRLASDSVRFTDAYAAAPVCTPTRASILTGKTPARLHMTIWREASADPPLKRKLLPPIAVSDLPHDEITLAEVLHEAGYYTAHVGKWHLGDASYFPETQGFDANIGGSHWGAPTTFFFPYSGSGTFGNEFRYVPHLELGSPGEYLTDRLTSEAIRIVEHVHDRPFFLNMWWHTVHTPIEAPETMVEPYRQKLNPRFNHRSATYAAMVESLDTNVGRLLAKFDELGVADRTIVVFTSDNGGFINQNRGQAVTNNAPLRSGKGSLYEGGVRVPLMIRWPGVTSNAQTCRQPVSTIDFYPTVLQIAGLKGNAEHNATVDGKSLVPLLKQPDARLDRETLYWHYPHYYPTTTPVSSIRKGDWKLLHYYEDDRVELYNLADDRGEEKDQAAVRPEVADSLREQLDTILEDVNAQSATPNH
jgi:arylsulfatase A-like enzyme